MFSTHKSLGKHVIYHPLHRAEPKAFPFSFIRDEKPSVFRRIFHPFSGYLNCWCFDVKSEWAEFLARFFATFPCRNEGSVKLLDVGCGPNIANIISASQICTHITMADYLTSNRNEVERFKTNADDAFQWQHYFTFLSGLEPDINAEQIMQRTNRHEKTNIEM